MTRREMVEELLERLEGELDELSNPQLDALIAEYEHSPMLGGVIESLGLDSSAVEEEEEDKDEEELPLIDGDWSEDEEETDE